MKVGARQRKHKLKWGANPSPIFESLTPEIWA